jgi:signal transduction histidine kinase/ligand-binding sensor domain-containing protein
MRPKLQQLRWSRMFSQALAVSLWVMSFASAAFSAQPSYHSDHWQFDHWTTDDGLPQNAVNAILQTRDGYLWLATFDGLVRFDGVRFTVFNKSNTKGIGGNRFDTLYEDRHGALWATTEDSWLVKYQAGAFATYTPKEGLPAWNIRQIEEDAAGNFQIVAREGIAKWKDGRFAVFALNELLPASIGAQWIAGNKLAWLAGDKFYFYTHGRLHTYSMQAGLPSLKLASAVEDQHGTIWLRAFDAGLIRVKDGHFAPYPVTPPPLTLHENRSGTIWLAWDGWLGQWNNGSLKRQRMPYGFLVSSDMSFYEDREGNFWLGAANGLYRIREPAISVLTRQDGLASDNIYSIYEDRAGQLWFGAWGAGVTKLDAGCAAHYRARGAFGDDFVTALYQDRAGALWIGSMSKLYRLDPTALSDCQPHALDKRNAQPGPEGFFDNGVWAIHQDRAGRFWFGTSKGLIKYEGGGYTRYTTADGLAGDNVKAIVEDRAGRLWFGTWGGLSRYADGRFTSYTEQDGLASDHIRALYEDADGILWIGTYDGGLTRWKEGRFTRYTLADGLFNNGVFQILEDGRGYFWMSSNRGIYRVKRQELNDFAEGKIRSITSVAYGKADGLLTLECNGGRQPAGWKARDGRLWFPTAQGAAVIDPARVTFNQQPPPVIIEEFRLGNDAMDFRNGVRVSHSQDSFEISYTAPSFIKPEHVRFKYKLEGLDEAWIDAGQRRAANYNRLPPGSYRFVVSAANSDGVWNTTGASVAIEVIPPVWRRWWFLTLAVLALAALVWKSYERRVTRLRREHAQQAAFSQRLLQSQEAERKRIAEELHGSLAQDLLILKNDALLGLKLAAAGSPAQHKFEEISAKTSQAYEGVREIAHNLRPSHLDTLGLRDALEFMLEKVGASSAIRFTAELDALDGLFTKEAEMNLYRIAEEALNNVIKHSGASAAKLSLKRDGRRVQLTIADNGRGFQAEAGATARGFGLTGIAERARMLGGEEVIHSAPGQGTTITINLWLKDG